MTRLQQLVDLKRAATDIDGLDAYVDALYTATRIWCADAHTGVAALHIDGLVDAAAHDKARNPYQEATDAPLSPEPAPVGNRAR